MSHEQKNYVIVDHKSSGIKVFIQDGIWSGMFLIFDNFDIQGGRGIFTYEVAGLPSHLMYLLKENLTEHQQESMMNLVNGIASDLFSLIRPLK